ncbi:MAG: hypothetical protein IJJ42_12495 [Clostridia bacterium]|nr:hypothetical protein [Clostridia bacterium]
MKTTVAAIDFGTSKIVTLVAENSGNQRCDIVAAGVAKYDGYLEEGWNNPGMLDEAIRRSLQDAEEQSNTKIREINVGVPGAFTRVYATKVTLSLKGTDPRVTSADVKNAFNKAAENLADLPGVVVHSSPAWFMVDNGKKTLEPVGMKGREMTAFISFVVGNRFFVDDVTNRMADLGVSVAGFYSTSAGEAMLYLNEQDRDHTSVLIDMGYLNTEIIGVEGDAIIYHKVLDVGGGDIAVALAENLDISLSAAEDIKRQFVYGIETGGESYEVQGEDGLKAHAFTRDQVKPVICKAVDEIAVQIKEAVDEDFGGLGNWSSVFMTGGGLSFNRGGKEYLSGKLGRPVQETPRRTTKLNSHSFSSALGLMDLIIDTIEQQRQPSAGAGGKLKDFFRSLLGG